MTANRFPIAFRGGEVALAVRAPAGAELGAAIRGMGLTTGVPTLVLVGTGSRPALVARLGPLLEKVVLTVAEAVGATVVDEGTADGVPGLLGAVRAKKKAGFPLVGVASDPDPAPLDPQHTHFVVVPADPGDLAPWVARVADAVAGGNRSVALVAAGGEAAWASVRAQVAAGRPAIAVARSGGAADHLVAAVAGRPADERATALVRSGRISAVDPGEGARRVAEVVREALVRPDPPAERGLMV